MTLAAGLGDQSLRQRALDPARSFIVQAPAGSGKTELLIQRYLRLLATVDEPEEILAVTFTRKAAGEMRSRVIGALQMAGESAAPEQPHLARSWSLARAILDDPQRRDWQLLRHPARLRISTIDAVNQWLARRSPLTGGTGVLGQTSDTPEPFYRDAARRTLHWLAEHGTAEAAHVRALLVHLDNDTGRCENLLTDMLSKRDQWLHPVLAADGDRERMEQPLLELTRHHLQLLDACLDDGLKHRLAALLSFAARTHQAGNSEPGPWLGQQDFPDTDPRNLPLWQAMVDALLTSTNHAFRKRLTKTEGFPPGCAEKERMVELIEECAKRSALRERLIAVRKLPGNGYAATQWQVLQHLLAVLKLAAAELRLVFAACGCCDFSEVASAALAALGDAQTPSSLGLALDHRIRHILVDEFQDTSLSQFELLGRLTAGWEDGDGRTIFLVGDPMQSIYRFRHAEVGVFMQVRDAGLGGLRPEFLQLTANFRSAPPLVAWFNSVFSRTFPQHDDALQGTVRYTPGESRSFPSSAVPAAVDVHWLLEDEEGEAVRVVELVRAALAEAPRERVCILVRSRTHAAHVLKALRRANLSFVAPDIENLELSAVAQDLLALTRALLHPADRLAWIGVLRAPWCGLSLVDLHALIGSDFERPVPELLAAASEHPSLGGDARQALARLRAVVQRAAAARGRSPLRDLVEGAWLELGGPATLREEAELETAHGFFSVLESVDAGGDCSDVLALAGLLRSRKGSLGSGRAAVEIMTMHKAKGLEFDTVILPGLSRPARNDTPPLLAWQAVPIGAGRSAVILAPPAAGGGEDPLYRYLQELERSKRSAELDRLLYVACTRARRRLHLIGRLDARLDDESGVPTLHRPEASALLAHLWEALREEAESALPRLAPPAAGADTDVIWVQPLIRRLPAQWIMPPSPPPVQAAAVSLAQETSPTLVYEWASRWAMLAGSVVHRWLQIIAEQGLDHYDGLTLQRLRPLWQRQLSALGAQGDELEQATARVMQALQSTLADPRGRWILGGADHVDAACELALTVNQGGRCRRIVIDRTLVSADGVRWLIDYKTSSHEGGDVEDFIALECERHRAQLGLYRDALSAIDSLPVQPALYFPLLGVFREFDPDTAP